MVRVRGATKDSHRQNVKAREQEWFVDVFEEARRPKRQRHDDDPQSLSSGVELGYEQVENDAELPNDDCVLVPGTAAIHPPPPPPISLQVETSR